MTEDTPNTEQLLARSAAGDGEAWGKLLCQHQERLLRMIEFRMDSRLRGRIDAADVLQEAFFAAASKREIFFRDATVPLFLWFRGFVTNKLLELHRHHLGTRMRDAKRDQPIESQRRPDETTTALLAYFTGNLTSPSFAAVRNEIKSRLADALNEMAETDREVLALRHFEQLTNLEAAQVLGIQERAAAKRYLRALGRLKDILSDTPGGLTGLRQ